MPLNCTMAIIFLNLVSATAKNSTLPTAAVSLFMPAAQAPWDSSVGAFGSS